MPGFCVIRQIIQEEKTAGGLVIPKVDGQSVDKIAYGVVVCCGDMIFGSGDKFLPERGATGYREPLTKGMLVAYKARAWMTNLDAQKDGFLTCIQTSEIVRAWDAGKFRLLD